MTLASAICTTVSQQSGAMLLSILIEALTAGIVGHYWLGNPGKLAVVAMSATLITHPFVWLLFAVSAGYLSYGSRLVLIEAAVVGAEAIAVHWTMRYAIKNSLILALLTNGASFLGGGLLLYLFRCQ